MNTELGIIHYVGDLDARANFHNQSATFSSYNFYLISLTIVTQSPTGRTARRAFTYNRSNYAV